MSKSKKRFASLLCELASGDGMSPPTSGQSEQLMAAFLDFGSQTDDNVNCYNHIEYGLVPPNGPCSPKETYGLKLRGKNILVADVIHLIEDLDIPDSISERIPNMTKNEWDAITRMATMVLLAFEYRSEKPQSRVMK